MVGCVARSRLCGDGLGWWRWRYIEAGVLGHHTLETDTDTLDDGEEDGATDGTVTDGLCASTDGESTAGEEACDDGVPGIFLFAVGETCGSVAVHLLAVLKGTHETHTGCP